LKDENDEELNFFISFGLDYFQMHYYPFQMFVITAWNAPWFVNVIEFISNNNLDSKFFESEIHIRTVVDHLLRVRCGDNFYNDRYHLLVC